MEPAPTAAPQLAPAPEMIPSVPVSSTSAGCGQMKGALMNDMLGSMLGGHQQSGGETT